MDSIHIPTIYPAPRNVPEFLAWAGLGTPGRRAAAAFVLAAGVSYATKLPRVAFTEDGHLKRFDINPADKDEPVTQVHFVVVPIAVATAAYLFF